MALNVITQVLGYFRAGGILQAMRDEVWGEGQIEEFENKGERNNPRNGLRLVSDPYTVVALRGSGGELTAVLEEDRSSFEIYVAMPNRPFRSEGARPEIHVQDNDIINLTNRVSAKKAVRDLGFEQGLDKAVSLRGRHTYLANWKGIPFQGEEAISIFDSTILAHVGYRREHNSLPGQIRAWAQSVIDELPSQLRTTGILTHPQLRHWAHEVRGSTLIYQAVDTVANRVGLRLKI